jgi:hypothetical protein
MGEIEYTCPKLHLTYLHHFSAGAEAAILELTRSLRKRNCVIHRIVITEAAGRCNLTGIVQPHTNVALIIHDLHGRRFRLRGLRAFAVNGNIPQVNHIRLVKSEAHWISVLQCLHNIQPDASPATQNHPEPHIVPPRPCPVSIPPEGGRVPKIAKAARRLHGYKCAITGSTVVDTCHLVPVAPNTRHERLAHDWAIKNGIPTDEDLANIILLTPTLHRALDRHMFSFKYVQGTTFEIRRHGEPDKHLDALLAGLTMIDLPHTSPSAAAVQEVACLYKHGPGPTSPPIPTQDSTLWAIYCCTGGDSDDLITQRHLCRVHAEQHGLVPVHGKVLFEDLQPSSTHPGARPGFRAFLESGATGMICAGGPLMVDKTQETAAMEYLRTKGIAFRSAGTP